MANKKRTKKKTAKLKRGGGKKVASAKSRAGKERTPKKLARKTLAKSVTAKRKAQGTKVSGGKRAAAGTQRNPKKSQSPEVGAISPKKPISRFGAQSGDLQGLSNVQGADSESVQELLEEGNAFEAEAVKGVEDAGVYRGREVHTHEVTEDDVPGEYLDKE